MSTADSWDFVVPDDEGEIVAELRRHGVRPGKHLFVLESGDQSVDVEGLRSAMALARAMAEALGTIHGEVAASLRTVIEPALEALRSATSGVQISSESMRAARIELTEEQRAAFASMADTLDQALRNRAPNNDAHEARPPRRLRFAGMISSEPDLSENFDHYLAQSYGED